MSPFAERREFRRLTAPIPVRFRLRGSSVVRQGTLVSISCAGGALLTPVALAEGGVIDSLRFSLPAVDTQEATKISVSAGVVSSELQHFADSSERYRSGLVFLDLTGKAFESVCTLIVQELDRTAARNPNLTAPTRQ